MRERKCLYRSSIKAQDTALCGVLGFYVSKGGRILNRNMKLYRIVPKSPMLAFDLGECCDHVSQDVYDKLEAHSAAYKRHKKAIQILEFPSDELTERQELNAKFFSYAMGSLESVVCDRLWAVSVFAEIRTAILPGASFLEYLDEYTRRFYQTAEFTNALAEVNHSFSWMRMCMDVRHQERLEQYKRELFCGLRLVAIETVNHGREFGRQIIEIADFSKSETKEEEI